MSGLTDWHVLLPPGPLPTFDLETMGSIPNTPAAQQPRLPSQLALAGGGHRGGGGGGGGGGDKPTGQRLNMFAIQTLVEMVDSEPDLCSGFSMLVEGAFGDGFRVVLLNHGDRALPLSQLVDEQKTIELAYLNSDLIKSTLRRFQHRALVYSRLLHFFVLRAPVDPALWLLSAQEATSAQARRQAALPLHVEELKAQRGELHYDRDERGNGVITYVSTEPVSTSKIAPRFTFPVYIDPTAANIEPMTALEFKRRYPRLVRQLPGLINSDRQSFDVDSADLIVNSEFWALKELQLKRNEMDEAYDDAISQLARVRPVMLRRPFREVSSELLGDDVLARQTDMAKAHTSVTEDIRAETFEQGYAFRELTSRDPVSKGGIGDGLSKRQVARLRYNRPDMWDDVADMREDFQIGHIPTPVATADARNHAFTMFQLRCAQLLGGLPLEDLLTGVAAASAIFSGMAGTQAGSLAMALEQMQRAHRAMRTGNTADSSQTGEIGGLDKLRLGVYRRVREQFNAVFAWVYPQTFGRHDLFRLNQDMEKLDELERTSLGHVLHPETRASRRRLLYQAWGSSGREKKKKEEKNKKKAKKGAAASDQATTDSTSPPPTHAELRELVQRRLATVLDAMLLFEADLRESMALEQFDDFDHLPTEMQQSRLERGKLIKDAVKDHSIGAESLIRFFKDELGFKVTKAPPEEFALLQKPEPAAATAVKKKPTT